MSFRFTREVLKISAGQICQNIGWHAVQSSPMDILVDVTHRYLREICKAIHSYSNQYNRTEPNLDDVALAFRDLGIILQEIEEYVSNVEPVPFAHKVPAFPVTHPPNLQYPNPASRELSFRPEHIPAYLPLMHPDLEEEDGPLSPVLESGQQKKNSMENSGATAEGESTSPLNSPKHGSKRPNEWSNDIPISKKPRHYTEEEGRPMREMTSVFMTPTGFISPAREGRAPDPTLPNAFDSPPSTPEPPPPPPPENLPVKKESKSKDSKKDKSSKSKKDKDSNKKDTKKIKTSKKENKENTAFSSEKSVVPSSSSKKEHTNSHKSGKSDKSSIKSSDPNHTKIKIDKIKHKEGKDEHKKSKEHSKSSKSKSKIKHGSSSKSLKSSKAPKSPQKSAIKSPKKSSSKSPKSEKKSHVTIPVPLPPVIAPVLPPPPLPPPSVIKKELEEVIETYEIKEEKVDYEPNDMANDYDDEIDSREESPEPRLVIDDSLETQARQERESRMALFDESINTVIQRGQEESELEAEKSHKAVDDVINEVARGPMVRKFMPKDIYDFTDSSELSSLSSLEPGDDDDDDSDSSIDIPPMIKKEKAKTPELELNFENPKKTKSKGKQSKKTKDSKPKSPGLLSSSKSRKSPNVIVKREERSPSRIRLKEDIFSSDASSLSPSPSPPPSFSEFPSQKNGPSSMSDMPPTSPFIHSPSVPSTSFSSSPFAPIPPMPCHIQANPHFPTPPLFVTTKSDAFPDVSSPQPLNLAKSSSSSFAKGTSEGKVTESHHQKSEDMVDSKKSESTADKDKFKLHRKDKKEKEKKSKIKRKNKEPKEKEKSKPKVKVESAKEKEKLKEVIPKEVPKESPPKAKPDKPVKKRGRPEKKKNKDKMQKSNNDDSVTKLTLKFAGGSSGSGQFVIKPSSKRLSSPPSSSPGREDGSLSPLTRSPTPPPSKAVSATPPSPLPPARQPSPPPAVITFEPPVATPVTPAAVKTHSRGRGRGRKPAAQPAAPPPPARTVITETLGTIVDEQGNKIWICPACTRPDDGSPMIGCDECDDWYHWVCVGIVVPPKEEESWYCTRCISKRQSAPVKQRRKKHKKGGK